jgi:DNA-binding MarR family transcriptional regulator
VCELTLLEFFLLALISKAGLTTVYALRNRSGLSWGGIRPSLVRLEQWGLLARAPIGKLNRREFVLTEAGRHRLRSGWSDRALQVMRDPAADLDSLVWAGWLTWVMEPSAAAAFLDTAFQTRRIAAQFLARQNREEMPEEALEVYHWMRTSCRGRQLEAEQQALEKLCRHFEEALKR